MPGTRLKKFCYSGGGVALASELEWREATRAAAAGEPVEARLALDWLQAGGMPGVDAVAAWSSWESAPAWAMIEDVVAQKLQASLG